MSRESGHWPIGQFRAIYVLYDRGVRTGGPEALHQLVAVLRQLGQNAFLVPHSRSLGASRVEEYAHYDAPECRQYEDDPSCAVLAAETDISLLYRVKKATRICWWLSVDNSPVFYSSRERTYRDDFSIPMRLKNWARDGRALGHQVRLRRLGEEGVFHLAQSSYAWHYIYDHLNVTPTLVSDYTPTFEIDATLKLGLERRALTVAFNPKKGGRLIDALRQQSTPYKFVPIEKMTRKETLATLAQCAVYLDLGHHPGKDRMPREAALLGAVVLVAQRGSAANSQDVPLPLSHKLNVRGGLAMNAASRLESVFSNIAWYVERQQSYVGVVRSEPKRFECEVAAFFVEGRYGYDAAESFPPEGSC